MSTVDRRRQQRDDYLVALYDLSDGDVTRWPTHRDIAERIELPVDEATRIGMQWQQDRACEFMTMAGEHGQVAITAAGIRRAEQIIREREAADRPPYSTIALLTDAELLRTLEPLVDQLRRMVESADDAEPDELADAAADVHSVGEQLRATHPNRGVIRAGLERLRLNWGKLLGTATVLPAVTDVLRRLGH